MAHDFLLVVCGNNVSILHRFRDTTTFTMHVTVTASVTMKFLVTIKFIGWATVVYYL